MKTPQTDLELAAPEQTQLAAPVQLSPAALMQAVIEKGISAENVGVLEKLIELNERVELRNAEREFARAFVALQAEMPPIFADKPVPNRDGTIRYKFAPYDYIMEKVRPLLQKHGFTVTFSMQFSEGRVIQNCTLQHIGGHSRTNQFAARIGSGPPGSSEAQGDGAASTYAKRFAFCNALNITIEMDNDGRTDARNEGDVIGADKVQYLKEQVREAAWNEAGFLKLAGVATFEEVREGSYPVLIRAIEAKKAQARKPQ